MSCEQEKSIKKEKLTYTSCYWYFLNYFKFDFYFYRFYFCFKSEENIWKFLEFISSSNDNLNIDEFYAIFISNKNKMVTFLCDI